MSSSGDTITKETKETQEQYYCKQLLQKDSKKRKKQDDLQSAYQQFIAESDSEKRVQLFFSFPLSIQCHLMDGEPECWPDDVDEDFEKRVETAEWKPKMDKFYEQQDSYWTKHCAKTARGDDDANTESEIDNSDESSGFSECSYKTLYSIAQQQRSDIKSKEADIKYTNKDNDILKAALEWSMQFLPNNVKVPGVNDIEEWKEFLLDQFKLHKTL